MKNRPLLLCAVALLATALSASAEKPVDGKFPPPKAPEGKWESLFTGPLEEK